MRLRQNRCALVYLARKTLIRIEGWHYNASGDGTLIAMLTKLVVDDQLRPHIGKRLQCLIRLKIIRVSARFRV